MPIKFRCPHCQQFLGISRAKAGNITDCPTCGRTIRIPNLDGTVEALPPPQLNFQDAGLRDALASLASLDEIDAPQSADVEDDVAADAEDKIQSVPFVVASDSRAREVIEPDIREAPPVIVPVVAEVEPPPAPNRLDSSAASTGDPLSELATAAHAPSAATPTPTPSGRRTRRTRGGLLLGSVLLSFAAGLAIGYSFGTSSGNQSPTGNGDASLQAAPDAPEQAPAAPLAALPNGRITVRGTLTYKSQNNQTLGDAESRILIFPEQHPGQVKLPIQGFRAGADPADRRVAEASIQALGGEYVTADKAGRYMLRLPPGSYHLLFISRYSPREENAQLIDPVQNLATAYFDRPQLLIGQVNYHYVKLTLGTEPQTIDHLFNGP